MKQNITYILTLILLLITSGLTAQNCDWCCASQCDTIYYQEDFNGAIGNEWNNTNTLNNALGEFGADQINLSLSNLPCNDSVSIVFDLILYKSWDGNGNCCFVNGSSTAGPDIFQFLLNNNVNFKTTFSNTGYANNFQTYPDAYDPSNIIDHPAGTGSNFYQDTPWPDLISNYTITLTTDQPLSALSFTAQQLGSTGVSDESWGIDNVKIKLHKSFEPITTIVDQQCWSTIVNTNINIPSNSDSIRWEIFSNLNTPAISTGTSGTFSYTFPATGGTYYIKTTNHYNNCYSEEKIDTVYIQSASQTISLGNDTAFCDGGAVTLQVPIQNNIIWDDNSTSNTRYIDQAGTYYVTHTETVGGMTCTQSDTIIVSTASIPNPTFSALSTCISDSVEFNNLTNINGTYEWKWDFGNGDTSIVASPTYQYQQAGTYVVTLTATNTIGCAETFTDTITLSDGPLAFFNAQDICLGDSLSIQNTHASSNPNGSIDNWIINGNSSVASPDFSTMPSGSYIIELIADNSGCIANYTDTITVFDQPIIGMNFTGGCISDSVTFNNLTNGNGTITWEWEFGNGDTSSLFEPTYQYQQAGTYIVSLTATTNGGCSDSYSDSITLIDGPLAQFTSQDICLGDSLTIENIHTPNNPTGTVDSWIINGNNSATTPNFSTMPSGSYIVELIANNSGCSASYTDTIKVFDQPIIGMNFTGGCISDSVTFNNLTNVNGAIMWEWAFGNGDTSSLFEPTYQYQQAGTYNVSLTATTSSGCSDSYSDSITLIDGPLAQFISDDICLGDSLSIENVQATNNPIGTIDSWVINGNNTLTVPEFSSMATGDYIVQLISDNNGCSATYSDTITIHDHPVVSANFLGGCISDSITFSNLTNVNGTYSWEWDFGNGDSSTLLSPVYQYTQMGTYVVTLTATNSGGCTATYSDSITLTNGPLAQFDVSPVCEGQTAVITNTHANSNPSGTVDIWYLNGTQTPSPDLSTLTVGAHYLKLVSDNNGCTAEYTDSIHIIMQPTIAINFTDGCISDSITFNNTSAIGPNFNWMWDFGNGDSSTVIEPNYQYTQAGNYLVKVTATSSNGCNASFSDSISLFDGPLANFNAISICLGDTAQLINVHSVNNPSGTNDTWYINNTVASPNISSLTTGEYIVRLVSDNNGCTANYTDTIHVLNQPNALFNVQDGCLGNPTSISNTSLSSGNINWKWEFGNGDTSTVFEPTYKYTQSGTHQITLTATNSGGCSSTYTTSINLFDGPMTEFDVSNICLGSPISLVNNYANSNPLSTNYTWKMNGSIIPNSAVNNYVINQTGEYIITLDADNNGCSSSYTDTLFVSSQPEAAFSVQDGCLGEQVTLNNSSIISVPSSQINWEWDLGDGTILNQESPTHQYTQSGTYIIKLTVGNNTGCTSIHLDTIQQFTVPKAAFNINNHCFGNSVELENNWSTSNPIGTINQWVINNTDTFVGDNISYTFDVPANQIITLNSISPDGCIDSKQENSITFPSPTAKFSIDTSCVNDTTQFIDLSSQVHTQNKVKWLINGTVLSGIIANYVPSSENTTQVTQIVENDKGCVDSLTKTFHAFPLPIANFSVTNACLNSPTVFTDSSSISSGTINHSIWEIGENNITYTNSTPSHTYSNTGQFSIDLTVTSEYNCTAKMSKTTNVYAVPTAVFTVENSCLNEGPTNSNNQSSITSSDPITYTWNMGDNTQLIQNSVNHQYSSPGNYIIQLIAKSDKGCIDSIEHDVTIYPSPTVSFTTDTNSGCSPLCISPTNTSQYDSLNNINWYWNFGNGIISSQKEPAVCYDELVDELTYYDIILTAINKYGCMDSITKQDYIKIDVLPVADFTYASEQTVEDHLETNFSNISTNGFTYKWTFGDDSDSNVDNPYHEYLNTGSYNVKLIAYSPIGCVDSMEKVINIYPSEFFYVPNSFTPNADGYNDTFFFKGNGVSASNFSFIIFDRWGHIVYETNTFTPWDGKKDNQILPTGVYTYKFVYQNVHEVKSKAMGSVHLLK